MRIRLKRFAAGAAALAVSASMLLSFSYAFSAQTDSSDVLVENIYDYSSLNTVTLGEAGYIDVEDDSFVVNLDGAKTDIRFFGVDVSLTREGLPADDQHISDMLAQLAYQGCNLIRFKDCYAYFMLSANTLDENKMILLDKLLAEARNRGMYVAFDMFTLSSLNADGISMLVDNDVIGRAERFFRRFFDRVNTINGQYYATDTVIAFIKYVSDAAVGWQPAGTDSAAKYGAQLQPAFNAWLLEKYTSKSELDRAWRNPDGTPVLADNEDPKKGTVAIGAFATGGELTAPADATGYARTADFYAFLGAYAQQQFDSMVTYCRDFGYRSPILCTDMTANTPLNLMFSGQGAATSKSLAYIDGLSISDAMQQVAAGEISQKPYVLSFDTSAAGASKIDFYTKLMLYTSMQGVDALMLSNYSYNASTSYNVRDDAQIWSRTGLMATIFRYRLAKEALNQAEIVYTHNDNAMENGNYGKASGLFPLITAVGNAYVASEYTGEADVAVSSGNSSSGTYTKAERAIIQSYESYTSAGYNDSKKESWYNSQGLKSAIEPGEIGGKEVYIGENKAILPTGTLENTDELTQALAQLGMIDDTIGYKDGVYVSDTEQLKYTADTDTLVADCNRISVFCGELSGTMETENITISGFSGRGTVIVYALGSGVTSANAMGYRISAVDASGAPISGSVTINREDTTISAYNVGADGLASDSLEVAGEANVMTVKVNGTSTDSLISLKDVDVDAALEGYDIYAAYPDRSLIALFVVIPGVSILIVAYILILWAERRKVLHEAALRKATLEKKMKQRSFTVQTFKRAEEKSEEELLGGKVIRMDSGKLYPYEVYDTVEEENVDPKWRFKFDLTPSPDRRVVRITAEQEQQVLAQNEKMEAVKDSSEPEKPESNK